MKFSVKLLLSTIAVLAIALGFSGFYFVNFVFETSLKREVEQALDENSILRFAFETAVLNVPMKYDVLQDSTIELVAYNLESGSHNAKRLLRICDEDKNVLYTSEGFVADDLLLMQTDETTKSYQVMQIEGRYYIQTAIMLNPLDRILYLETMKDVTEIFEERGLGFSVYRKVTVAMLICGTIIMYMISSWITKPIRLLTRATKSMANGDYHYRAKQVSKDELGLLTSDFNKMAIALEENVNKLEDEIQAKDEFVAAFAHELKTPLTSIIGYADLLRSRKLNEEKSFFSANYIYTEGKRLEAMSFQLLDMIVTKQHEIELRTSSVEVLFLYLQDMYAEGNQIPLQFRYDHGNIMAEENLIKTVLVNLIDNALKASEEKGSVEIEGSLGKEGYRFCVTDYGVGIPEEEIKNITKAFYMVDKSRARSKNGAGLGLAICAEILLLHHSKLEIESVLGEGTSVSFVLPLSEELS